MRRGARGVDDFRAALLADFERVDFLRAERALKFPCGRKNEDAARRIGGDVNVPRFINRHTAVAGTLRLIAGQLVEEVRDVFVFEIPRDGVGGEECEDSE